MSSTCKTEALVLAGLVSSIERENASLVKKKMHKKSCRPLPLQAFATLEAATGPGPLKNLNR
jgi:hypothetical protein